VPDSTWPRFSGWKADYPNIDVDTLLLAGPPRDTVAITSTEAQLLAAANHTDVDRGHSTSPWVGHREHIQGPGETATDKVHDLDVEDVPGKQQFPILQVWV
jgi:hypothetical protein